jgi:hypothetical protein
MIIPTLITKIEYNLTTNNIIYPETDPGPNFLENSLPINYPKDRIKSFKL